MLKLGTFFLSQLRQTRQCANDAYPSFERTRNGRLAGFGLHFILGQSHPAAACRSTQTLGLTMSNGITLTTSSFVPFMRELEGRYKMAAGLSDRSEYKIFYGPVRPARILVLGINPGGHPETVKPDGMGFIVRPDDALKKRRKAPQLHAASASYYENDESDLLDCNWTENHGLRALLTPLLGQDDDIRRNVVKTNLAFKRSPNAKNKKFIEEAKKEAAEFLIEIINVVRPNLILLAGADLHEFVARFCLNSTSLPTALKERDDSVGQVVFRAAKVVLRGDKRKALVVQVAHASQFSWTYERYGVAEEIRTLLGRAK